MNFRPPPWWVVVIGSLFIGPIALLAGYDAAQLSTPSSERVLEDMGFDAEATRSADLYSVIVGGCTFTVQVQDDTVTTVGISPEHVVESARQLADEFGEDCS